MSKSSSSALRSVLKWSNAPPLLTVLTASLVLSLSAVGVIELTIAENLIVGLVALLGIDALTERLSILKRIEGRLNEISAGQPLRSRGQIPSFASFVGPANEIVVVAISGISVLHQNLELLLEKIRDGCKVRIVLLDPQSPAVEVLHMQYGLPTAARDIPASLQALCRIQASEGFCEVRLLDVFTPFSVIAVNLHGRSGAMIVEFHTYKKTLGERPHVLLTARESTSWFNIYKEQLELAWSNAKPWRQTSPNPANAADA
jgi:hypothetical protein